MIAWFVWSSGLEEWERIYPDANDRISFKPSHAKTFQGKPFLVFVDPLGRYIASFEAKVEWAVAAADDLLKASLDDEVSLVASMSELIALQVDAEVIE